MFARPTETGARVRVAGACAAVAALALAGCGGSSSSSSTSTTSAAAAGSSGASSLAVKEAEFTITPKDGQVKAGKVTLNVSNGGKFTHALSIEDAAGKGKDVESGPISAGSSKSVTVTLKPGTYEWYCPIGNHKAMGMKGELVVK